MSNSNKSLRIAILGASSQVGSSVAFYLRHFTSHQVFCFIRSKYSAVFFEMSDIQTIAADLNDSAALKTHFSDMDVVLDFSLPSGQIFEIPKLIDSNFQNIIGAMPASARFFHMSSIMAYGMPSDEKHLQSYRFPRASYGYIKRRAEKKARAYGEKFSVPVYNFRLGQVHGFLQSVSESFREKLSATDVARLDGNADDLTNIIFISTLAEAIIKCGRGEVAPGTYTLVSSPQWTLSELYNYYLKVFSLNTQLVYQPGEAAGNASLASKTFRYLKKYRPLIETYLLLNMPETSVTTKGKFRVSEIASQAKAEDRDYIDFNLLGTPTLPQIEGIPCSVQHITDTENAMKELYFAKLAAYIRSNN